MEKNSKSPELIERLRAIAERQESVRVMVQAIHSHFGSSDVMFEVIRYFKEAFQLSLPEALTMQCYRVEGGSRYDDAQIDEVFLPLIAATRSKWCNLRPPKN